jgi:hypothetical protein
MAQQVNPPLPYRFFTPGELVIVLQRRQGAAGELRPSLQNSSTLRGANGYDRLFTQLEEKGEYDPEVLEGAKRAIGVLEESGGLGPALEQLGDEDIQTSAGEPGEVISTVFLFSPSLAEEEQDEVLVYLVGELNLRRAELEEELQSRILGISPGWRFSAGQGNLVTGGPGAQPVPVSGPITEADYHIRPRAKALSLVEWILWLIEFILSGFKEPQSSKAFQALVSSFNKALENPAPVDVYILDTIPPVEQLEAAGNNAAWARTASGGPLLAQLVDGLRTTASHHSASDILDLYYYPDLSDTDFHSPENPLPHTWAVIDKHLELKTSNRPEHMPDQGTFIAGIIHELAPTAHLHLIEVLNKYGVGTYRSLTWGINVISKLQSKGTRTVVNCSLTLAYHPDECEKGQSSWEKLFCILQATLGINFLAGLEGQLALLSRHTIVAAAGNDAELGAAQPKPRYPAAFPAVLGVGALTHQYTEAEYSNQPDDPATAGVAAFGGDVDPAAREKSHPSYGILGLYTCPEFPDGSRSVPPTKNETGWARWAGTSFATAVVSGAIARLLGANLTEQQILDLFKAAYVGEVKGFNILPLLQGRA